MKTRIIRSEDFGQIVEHVGLDTLMDQMIGRLEDICRVFDETRFSVRTRDGFHYDTPHVGLIEWMPVMQTGSHTTIKIVGYHPSNPEQSKLPSIVSTVGSYDTTTGHLTGLADGTFITALRTAAASAVVSKIVARPESQVVGLIGAGAQAVTQLHALLRCFPVRKVLIADCSSTAVGSFAARAAAFLPEHIEVREAPLDLLVQSSDILCTQTSLAVGKGPLFEDMETRPWLHVNAVGADFPGKTELPVELLRRSLVCPDFREQAALEGECQQLDPSDVGPDLVELVQNQGDFASYRERTTVFDSTGYALEDQAAMDLVMELAEKFDAGIDVQLEGTTGDPLNPYDVGRTSAAAIAAGAESGRR